MGFSLELLILTPDKVQAEVLGGHAEKECILWKYSGQSLDFGHVTRLEKLTSPHYNKNQSYSPTRRAGICVVDCITSDFWENCEEELFRPHFAPRIINEENLGSKKFKTVGGMEYISINCSLLFRGINFDGQVERDHNKPIALSTEELKEFWKCRHPYISGPFMWARCERLAELLRKSRDSKAENWQALEKDRSSVLIASSWLRYLEMLAEYDARAVFRFN